MLIIGASGFAKQLFDALLPNEYIDLVFYDDLTLPQQEMFLGRFPILHTKAEAERYFRNVDSRFALGVGKPSLRMNLAKKFQTLGGSLISVIAKNTQISSAVGSIGNGCCVLNGSIIEPDVIIGEGCLINLNVAITHDCIVGEYSEISPGASILGGCTIGDNCFIGAGAIVLPKIKLGDRSIIGAGAVVTKDVPCDKIVKGIPARLI